MATRLTSATTAGSTFDYFYDPLGNLDCVTTAAGAHAACNTPEGASVPSELVTDHSYDYLDRLATTRSYAAGELTDSASYVYDPVDRVVIETDRHPDKDLSRAITRSYQGISSKLTLEEITTDKADRVEEETKSYLYDVLGRRITLAHDKQTTLDGGGTTSEHARYPYGHDPQASVSLLLDDGTGSQGPDAASVKATYGYTPYGKTDQELTTGDVQPLDPINPFRYIGKYDDPATGSIDMGARRLSPNLGRFYQRDRYYGALANLGLTLDPLTNNRYAYAAGHPIGYVEADGHRLACGGTNEPACPANNPDGGTGSRSSDDPPPAITTGGGGDGGGGDGSEGSSHTRRKRRTEDRRQRVLGE